MDSQKRDEIRDRRREEALVRRVGDALDRLAHFDAGECPDAELIAAYQEKSLQADEITHWESHFAICGRCRKILAVLAAAVETPLAEKEVAHLGELIAATRGPAQAVRPIETARRDRLSWRGRWLAPALGVAAVLAVWFAMRPPWRTADQIPSGTLIAEAPKVEPRQEIETRGSAEFSRATPKKSSETDAEVLKERPVTRARPPHLPSDALAKNRVERGRVTGGLAPNSGVAEDVLRDETKEKADLKTAPAAAPPPPLPAPAKSAPALPREAQVQMAQEAPQAAAPPPAAAQSDTIAGGAAQVESMSRARPNSQMADKRATASRGQRTLLDLGGRNYVVLLKSPSGRVQWAAGRGGSIRRSSDGGRTWVEQASPLTEDWEAGAAISDEICWLVGDHGAIARSADVDRWEKILPPAAAADTTGAFPDWIGITASSARAIVIEARDSRRFTTLDGGKTWGAQ